MSKNIVIDGRLFEEISQIQLMTDIGDLALFIDKDNAEELPSAEEVSF